MLDGDWSSDVCSSDLILTAIIAGSIIVGIVINSLSGDSPKPPDYGDNKTGEFIYGNATVESIEIMVLESFPVQIKVNARGYLPDSCTEIHRITKEKEGNTFLVAIKTVRPADTFCTEVIVPFQEVISLDVYGLKAGIYNVDVNGVKGTFELRTDNIILE
jgi:inhibitor of cysteine peptidase